MESEKYYEHTQKRSKWIKNVFFIFLTLFIIFPIVAFFTYPFISGPTENFRIGEVFEIKKGMGISEIADFLEREKYIKSATVFKIYDKYSSRKTNDYSGIKAGKYIFKNRLDVFSVYNKLKNGVSGIDEIKITVLEGDPNFLIAKNIEKSRKFKNFSSKKFLELAKKKEGYLYPDTYNFSPYDSEEIVIKKMEENFKSKAKKVISEIEKTNKSLDKIVIIASLIEKEAGNVSMETKKHVSGIIYNRLKKGMLLQLDAVAMYIEKRRIKNSWEIRRVLNTSTSPYNLYKFKGLPPTAIGNPSIDSIEAAMYPMITSDIFYLTGRDGKFYYSKTGVGHNINKRKYITNFR